MMVAHIYPQLNSRNHGRGHFGFARTLDAIRRKYFWHSMAKGIRIRQDLQRIAEESQFIGIRSTECSNHFLSQNRPFETINAGFHNYLAAIELAPKSLTQP
jgi:integrase-like protein